MNPIKWVATETKKLQRADKNRKPYKYYNSMAWQRYRKKAKIGEAFKGGGGKAKTSTPPDKSAPVYKKKVPGGPRRGGYQAGVERGSSNFVFGRKTAVTYNVPTKSMGTVSHHLSKAKEGITSQLAALIRKQSEATKKTEIRKIKKEISEKYRQLKKLS